VLVVGGGWFLWNRVRSEPEVEAAGAGEAIIARAGVLAKNGKYDQAIALLQDIKPGDPQHDRAMVMIADLQQKKSTSAQMIDGMPAAQYFDQRVAAAQSAFDAHDYSAAKAAYEQAMRVKPLPPEVKARYDIAAQQASKLDAAKALFAERKYNDAIANLQPLLDQDPQNQSIRRMISAAHFNLAATALQEERTNDAIRELDEVLKEDPNDDLARRSRELAVRYNNEPKDLLYRIYVKYLPLRQAV
jgi:tetratricopeptide (TPR) repeat protein